MTDTDELMLRLLLFYFIFFSFIYSFLFNLKDCDVKGGGCYVWQLCMAIPLASQDLSSCSIVQLLFVNQSE